MFPHTRAKGRKGGRKGARAGEDDDDSMSIGSSLIADETVDSSAILADQMDDLSEKRYSTRVKALKVLLKLVKRRVVTEELTEVSDSMASALAFCLRKGKQEEAKLACQLATIVAVTLGGDNDGYYHNIYPALRRVIDSSRWAEARAEAATALCMACFVCSTEPDDSDECVKLMRTLFSNKRCPPQLCAAAITGWTLLRSTVRHSILARTVFDDVAPVLAWLLSWPKLAVRRAAGEALALLYDARWEEGLEEGGGSAFDVDDAWSEMSKEEDEDDDDDDDDDDGEEEDDDDDDDDDDDKDEEEEEDDEEDEKEVVERSDEPADSRAIAERLHELATMNDRRMNRRERKEQRMVFRGVLQTVQDGARPLVIMRVLRESVELTDWVQICRLAAFRCALGEGLLNHLQFNELLHDVFDFEGADAGFVRLLPSEKRYLSSVTREWKSTRAAARDRRAAAKASFVHTDRDYDPSSAD